MKKTILLLLLLFTVVAAIDAQYASRSLSKQQQAYVDSLKKVEYKHIFPILGQKAYRLGFDVPYPAGIMANYFWVKQGILINNLRLGLKSNDHDIPLTPIDFVEFGTNTMTANTFNVRPDLWIFPFLNVYGIFGYGKSTMEVNLTYPVEMKSVVEQTMKTAGVGLTGAFGLGPLFVVADINWSWTKPEKLDKPVSANIFSLRLGHTFQFKTRPERNIGIWVGAMRARIGAETVGEIALGDVIPPETFQKKDEIVQQYYAWYDGLNPANPIDKKKMEAADKVLTPIIEKLDKADGSAIIRYGIEKSPAQEWNMIIGGQFQLNKRWALRTEGGVLGDRKSFLLSANYRFKI